MYALEERCLGFLLRGRIPIVDNDGGNRRIVESIDANDLSITPRSIFVLAAVFDRHRHVGLLEGTLESVADRRTIVGMNPVECITVNKLVGCITRESLD